MSIRPQFSVVVAIGFAVLSYSQSAVLADPLHTVSVCSARFQGPCGTEASASPPAPGSPLAATVSESVGSCFPSRFDVSGAITAPRPLEFFGPWSSYLCASEGNFAPGSGRLNYDVVDELITFTRMDQAAAPGETVDVYIWIEYRFVGTASADDEGGSGTVTFGYAATLNSAPASHGAIGEIANFGGTVNFDTGWVAFAAGPVTVPLGVATPMTIRAEMTFSNTYGTCGSCGGPWEMTAESTMECRLLSQPFTFSGSGTYTADAEQLLIEDNTWPVSTACPWDCDGSADGAVNVSDLLSLLSQYDPEAPGSCTGGSCDFDGSGCVDVADLLKLLGHYDPFGVGCP